MGSITANGKKYPGNGMFYTICDVCGRKIRAKDAVRIQDKYNTLNNMVVCKKDADETNPQQRVIHVKEKPVRERHLLRSEQPDSFVFTSNPDNIESGTADATGSTAPDSPRYLTVYSAIAGLTELVWLPCLNPGSDTVSGYKIERESPVGGGFSTIDTTVIASGYYKDTTTVAATQYNYRVTAYSDAGMGSVSNSVSVTPS